MNSAPAFWTPLCAVALVCGIVLAVRAGRCQDLGRLLWSAPSPPYRWLAVVWIGLMLVNVFDHRQRWEQHPGLNLAVLFVLTAEPSFIQPSNEVI